MDKMQIRAIEKAESLTKAISSDERWNLQDELMCQVFGFTMYGYVFGYSRLICFLDVEDINDIAEKQLVTLGIGGNYAKGLIQKANQEFIQENNESLHNRLIGIGHSHFASKDITVLIDSIFLNTSELKQNIET